jgi:hypothetical protein
MPSHYWYHCELCSYRAFRYRNVKRCPDCKGNLVREEVEQERDGDPITQQERVGALDPFS